MGLNCSEDLFFWSSLNYGQKMGLIFSEDLFFGFFGLHLILGKKWVQIAVKTFFF